MNNTSTKINNNLLTNLYKKEFHHIFYTQKKTLNAHGKILLKIYNEPLYNKLFK